MEGWREASKQQQSSVGNTNLVTGPTAGSVTLVLLSIVDAPLTQQSDFGCIVGLAGFRGDYMSRHPVNLFRKRHLCPLRYCACASLSCSNCRPRVFVTPDSSHRRLLFLTAYNFFRKTRLFYDADVSTPTVYTVLARVEQHLICATKKLTGLPVPCIRGLSIKELIKM